MKLATADNYFSVQQDVSSLRARIRELIDSGLLTAARLAIEARIPRQHVTYFLFGPDAVASPVSVALSRWLSDWQVSAERDSWVETPTAGRIATVLAYAADSPSITVVYGSPGVGKTATVRHFRKERPNTWMVTASLHNKRPLAILSDIVELLDGRGVAQRQDVMSKEVMRLMLNAIDRFECNGLLILDEAQHLELKALDAIRYFHDQIGVGLALVGNESVFGNVRGVSSNRPANFAQLSSRVGRYLHLDRTTEEDIDAFLEARGVGGKPERELCQRVGALAGGLRNLDRVLREAQELAVALGRDLDVTGLRAAAKRLRVVE